MTGKELYEKYKGRYAERISVKGVICGYNSSRNELIMAIQESPLYSALKGWKTEDDDDFILNHSNNSLGYMYVNEEHVYKP